MYYCVLKQKTKTYRLRKFNLKSLLSSIENKTQIFLYHKYAVVN